MGCDSHLFLPVSVRQRDFIKAFAIMLGATATKESLGDSFHAKIDHGLSVRYAGSIDGTYNIIAGNVAADGLTHEGIHLNWHWCAGAEYGFPNTNLVSCATGEHRTGVLIRLAKLFGGYLDINDCDDIDCDVVGRANNGVQWDASNGESWRRKEQTLLDLHVQPFQTAWVKE